MKPIRPRQTSLDLNLLTTEETARLLGVTAGSLEHWRTGSHPVGPDFIKIVGRIWYSMQDLRRYVNSRRVRIAQPTKGNPRA